MAPDLDVLTPACDTACVGKFGLQPGEEVAFSRPESLFDRSTHYCPGCHHGIAHRLVAEALDEMKLREKAVVIDVCETEEFAAGHVGGAKNVPLGQLEERLPTVVKNKALPVVLVCASGARANRAVAIAKKLGYDNAQAMAGGMKAWREASLPVEKA